MRKCESVGNLGSKWFFLSGCPTTHFPLMLLFSDPIAPLQAWEEALGKWGERGKYTIEIPLEHEGAATADRKSYLHL